MLAIVDMGLLQVTIFVNVTYFRAKNIFFKIWEIKNIYKI